MARRKKKRPVLRSKFEQKVWDCLSDSGTKFEYETQSLQYVVPPSKKRYTPDFVVTTASGKVLYIESKGKFDPTARRKMELVVEQHPDKDIRMLFMRDNYIRKTSNTRYSDWCDKKGIAYAVSEDGQVPEEWLNE